MNRTKQHKPKVPNEESWLYTKWRPTIGWTYIAICLCDFIVFPILWSLFQAYNKGGVIATPWIPLTLQGAGLFHMAMGAILGVTAWTRGQEKMAMYYSPSTQYYSNINNIGTRRAPNQPIDIEK